MQISSYTLYLETAKGKRFIDTPTDHGLHQLEKWRRLLKKIYRYADNWVCSYDDHESLDKYGHLCVWDLGWVQDPMSFYERYNGRTNSEWVTKT